MKLEMSHNYILPYLARIYTESNLTPHKHYDMEIIYCRKGTLHYTINGKQFDLNANQMLIITPLATHSAHSPGYEDILLLKMGYAFLRNYFPFFSQVSLKNPVIDLSSDSDPWQIKTKQIFEDIYNEVNTNNVTSPLIIQGNMYFLSSCIIELYQRNQYIDFPPSNPNITKIDDIFQFVFTNYHDPITVDDAAEFAGYSKEYFCRFFKQISGETFHRFLSRVRIDQAKFLLANTSLPINEIAETIGIPDHKNFCRIFKEFNNATPSEYRNTDAK